MNYSKVIEGIRQSICLVFALDEKGEIKDKGSGFIFSKKGIIVTCNHVISEATAIKVKFPDDKNIYSADISIRDEEHDLALLKFGDNQRKPMSKADIGIVKEGMPIIFSGYPLSLLDLTTHQGILSAITKDATGTTIYLIDGTVNAGNSGCPLMTEDGKVIGVVNAKRRERSDLLNKVEKMTVGAVSLHGIDLVEIYQALMKKVNWGLGMAWHASY